MLVSVFKTKSVVSYIALIAIAFLVHAHLLVHPITISYNVKTGFIAHVLHLINLQQWPTSLLGTLYIIAIIVQALWLNNLLNQYKMFGKQGVAAALTYIIFSSYFTSWCSINAAIVASFLILIIITLLFKLYNNSHSNKLLYNIGLLCALCYIGYTPAAYIIFFALFAYAILKAFRFSELFIIILGVCSVLYLLASYYFLTDSLKSLQQHIGWYCLQLPIKKFDASLLVSICASLLLLIVGLLHWYNNTNRMVIQVRKNWSVLLVMQLCSLSLIYFNNFETTQVFYISIIPFAAFAAHVFLHLKNSIIANLFLLIALGCAAYINWVQIH